MTKLSLKTGCFAIIWICIQIVCPDVKLHAQHTPQYFKYYSFEQVVNPAITGRDRYPFVNFSNKKYWLSTANSPFEICLGGAFRLGNINFYNHEMMLNKTNVLSRDRMGFGGFLMYEQNGPLGYVHGQFSYSYHVPMNRNSTSELSFGLSAQFSNYNVNTNLLDPADLGDPYLINLDRLPTLFDAGFGIYYNDEQFWVGASINDILANQYPLEAEAEFTNKQDYFFQTGYKFYLTRFELEPSVFTALIDDQAPYFSGQLKAYYRNYNWISVGYMSTNSMRVALGIRVRRMHLVYAFEQSVSQMAKYFSNSHELMIGLNIGLYEPQGLKKTVKHQP